jgi:hypothetical protein
MSFSRRAELEWDGEVTEVWAPNGVTRSPVLWIKIASIQVHR